MAKEGKGGKREKFSGHLLALKLMGPRGNTEKRKGGGGVLAKEKKKKRGGV